MAIVKHLSIKNNPLATLKYIVGETKEQKAAIVTGINCSEDPESAYSEMAMCYEHYSGEKFHRVGNPTGKEHLKMHHYVISFKGQEVTPEEADRIVQEWVKVVFEYNRQILIATHTDTNNIHVHVAVNAFDMNGKRWLDNKKTMNLCREKINAICKKKKLNVIENPKYNTRQNYAEWLANRNGTSWKHKLCDDIDKIVLMEDIHNIDEFIRRLAMHGYYVRKGKYISVRPSDMENIRPVRTLRLGDGYGIEELQYRIENKNREMSLDKILSYTGVQREYALCLRQIQINLYRKVDRINNITFSEVRRTAELLCYIHNNNIHSREDFARHVNDIAEKADKVVDRYKELYEKIKDYEIYVEYGKKQLELQKYKWSDCPRELMSELAEYCRNYSYRIRNQEELDNTIVKLNGYKKELSNMQEEYENARAAKSAVTAHYTTFLRQMDEDYSGYLKNAKKELEEYEASFPKPEPPKKVVEDMAALAEKVRAKEEERKRLEEEQRKAEIRRNRNRYAR